MVKFQEEKQKLKVAALRRREEEESVQMVSEKYRLPYVNLSTFPIEIDALKILSEEEARSGQLVAFQSVGRHLKIGVRNPKKEETRSVLNKLGGDRYTYDLFLVSASSLEHAWEFYKKVPATHQLGVGSIEVSPEKLETLQKEVVSIADIQSRIGGTFLSKTTEILEIVLAGALVTEASDVHIEPAGENVRLRMRLDGVLHDVSFFPQRLYRLLLSRIKLVAELKLNIHDRAQDGRFTIKTGGADVEVRVSVLPGPYGENTVLRILNPKTIQIKFEGLGMQPRTVEIMAAELKKPNGMILTTGPTGSGKTTTLYAFIRKIHTPAIKIITIEDPIEYHLPGVEQTQVDHGKNYNFSNGLRAIVRQDPDVVMVGEIRDIETAETAMHASLTGHLVFSTLHTNSAAGTIPRLLDLGVKPAIIAPAINVSLAQRLVRRLCSGCRVPKKLSASEEKRFVKELKEFPQSVPLPNRSDWTMFSAGENGCISCNGLGYRGRVGLFEIILIDEAIERLILKEPSEFEIKKEAAGQGQITMKQDGILKVLSGITDFAELERVVGTI